MHNNWISERGGEGERGKWWEREREGGREGKRDRGREIGERERGHSMVIIILTGGFWNVC